MSLLGRNAFRALFAAAALLGAAALTTGCSDDAYCFTCDDADGGVPAGSGGAGGDRVDGGDSDAGCIFDCIDGGSGGAGGGAGGGGPCEVSNGGIEICDKKDNDCNGAVDDLLDLDLTNATALAIAGGISISRT